MLKTKFFLFLLVGSILIGQSYGFGQESIELKTTGHKTRRVFVEPLVGNVLVHDKLKESVYGFNLVYACDKFKGVVFTMDYRNTGRYRDADVILTMSRGRSDPGYKDAARKYKQWISETTLPLFYESDTVRNDAKNAVLAFDAKNGRVCCGFVKSQAFGEQGLNPSLYLRDIPDLLNADADYVENNIESFQEKGWMEGLGTVTVDQLFPDRTERNWFYEKVHSRLKILSIKPVVKNEVNYWKVELAIGIQGDSQITLLRSYDRDASWSRDK